MRFRLTFTLTVLTVLAACSIPLGKTAQPTLSVKLESGSGRFVSPSFASWTIQGTSDKGATLPSTKFKTKSGSLKGLTEGLWTFDVKVFDASDIVVQTAQKTIALVVGQDASAVFVLAPVININVAASIGATPVLTVVPTGDVTDWPAIDDPYVLTLTATAGFETYTWILNGAVQPETGNTWITGPYDTNNRLELSVSVMQLIVTKKGQTYSVVLNFEKAAR